MLNHPNVILSNITTSWQAIVKIEEFLKMYSSTIITSEETIACIYDVVNYIKLKKVGVRLCQRVCDHHQQSEELQ